MNDLMALLFLICIICSVLGIIKPGLVIKWGEPSKVTRKKAILTYGSGIIIFFILFGVTIPDEYKTMTEEIVVESNIDDSAKEEKTEKERKKEEKELNKKIKEAKKNLNNKKYNEVLETLNPELDKDIDVSEAELLCNMVKYYIGAKEDFENKMYETAKEKLTAIDTSYEEYKIKTDIEELRANIENKLAYKEEINTKIAETAALIDGKELQSAKSQIGELLNKDIDDEQKLRLTELDGNVDLMIEEEKKAEAERKRVEEEKRKQEELRKQQEELKKQQEAANKKVNNNSSSSNNKTSSNSGNSGTTGGKTYYIASGNRYYHKTPSCKFIAGSGATATSDVSGKFACNCVKY